jgi:hypothetical protein
MFPDHLRLHLVGIDIEMLGQVNAEAQAVEEGAGAEHAIMPGTRAGGVGERIRRIGDNQDHRARRRPHNARNDVAIDLGVGIE